MKKKLTIAGLILHIVYYIFAILSLGDYAYSGYGVGLKFAYWLYAMCFALFCIGIYYIDVFWSILLSRKPFQILKFIVILLAAPLCLLVGGSAGAANAIIWNVYFAFVFAVQVISLFVKSESV